MYARELIEKQIIATLLFSENYVGTWLDSEERSRLLFYILLYKYVCMIYIKNT
jgi:hypothetical protein